MSRSLPESPVVGAEGTGMFTLSRRHHPLVVLPVVAAALLGVGALVLMAGPASVAALDTLLLRVAYSVPLAPAPEISFLVTTLGDTDTALAVSGAAAAGLLVLRHWREAAALGLAIALTQGLVALLKGLVSRPRPAENEFVAGASGFSFPSGHSATSMALYATLTVLVLRACRGKARVAVALVGVVLILAVGLSRVYLGAHYPSDVLAGWITGGLLVLLSLGLVGRLSRSSAARAEAPA